MSRTIWFDMDGVLVDLSKGLSLADGYEDPVLWFIHQDNGKLTFPLAIERHIDDEIFKYLPAMPSFLRMKVLMRGLINRGYTVNILSSSMDQPYSDKIAKQKREWCMLNLLDVAINEVVIVKGSKLKVDYIKEGDILIDDYINTWGEFKKRGIEDRFVLFTNFNKVVSQLFELKILD